MRSSVSEPSQHRIERSRTQGRDKFRHQFRGYSATHRRLRQLSLSPPPTVFQRPKPLDSDPSGKPSGLTANHSAPDRFGRTRPHIPLPLPPRIKLPAPRRLSSPGRSSRTKTVPGPSRSSRPSSSFKGTASPSRTRPTSTSLAITTTTTSSSAPTAPPTSVPKRQTSSALARISSTPSATTTKPSHTN